MSVRRMHERHGRQLQPLRQCGGRPCDYDTTTSGCPTDVDGDGSTGTQDLLLFLGSFGQTCLD